MVDYHIFTFDVKHYRPAVVDDVHRFGVGVDEFGHHVWAFAVGSSGIGKCLYLAENAVSEIVSARRLKLTSDVVGYLVEVAYSLIAHYHRVT